MLFPNKLENTGKMTKSMKEQQKSELAELRNEVTKSRKNEEQKKIPFGKQRLLSGDTGAGTQQTGRRSYKGEGAECHVFLKRD